ncbi:MAG: RsbRD N-terminal domain-containing protein [Desulfobacterales bacterium]|nr:MAG: RsbRD N-terminal domain-containing protein [Desulfobacterales bacterium]
MGTGLERLLEKHKTAILKNWFESAIQAYAPDMALFISGKKDPFANPVGSTTLKGLEVLLDQLIADMDRQIITSYLDPIIRIRAVQDFTPSQATAFILLLKKILRHRFADELRDHQLAGELVLLEAKIDQLCLMAFDIYMACREKIYEIKAAETRNRTFRAFERAGLITDTLDEKPGLK